jgi:Xaa-Pro aminopeptidase
MLREARRYIGRRMARALRRGAGNAARPDFGDRVARLRRAIRRGGFDGLLISNPNDIRYLTGFSGEASAMVVTGRGGVIISDFRFQEELRPLRSRFEVVIRKGAMLEAQAAVVKRLKPRRLAVQAESLSAQQRGELAAAVGARRVRDSVGLVAGLRLKKDSSEIAAIERAASIQQEAMRAVRTSVRAGQTEREIAARLEYEMAVRGAEGTSFQTIVAAGANGSKPHYRAGPAKTVMGRTLLIDWGARFDGYCSDMTRVFALGSWPRKLREVYEVVLGAQMAAMEAARPGMTASELDGVARGIIAKAGYGREFGHGLGHGIGLDIHESPRLFTSTTTALEPGMVITIEPGVYLPGVGGVRIEDDILITDRGARSLCSLPKDLKWATLHG